MTMLLLGIAMIRHLRHGGAGDPAAPGASDLAYYGFGAIGMLLILVGFDRILGYLRDDA